MLASASPRFNNSPIATCFHFASLSWKSNQIGPPVFPNGGRDSPIHQLLLRLIHIPKGQLISKRLLLFSNSSKKRTKQFDHSTVGQRNEFVRSFVGWIVCFKKTTTLSDLYSSVHENRIVLPFQFAAKSKKKEIPTQI